MFERQEEFDKLGEVKVIDACTISCIVEGRLIIGEDKPSLLDNVADYKAGRIRDCVIVQAYYYGIIKELSVYQVFENVSNNLCISFETAKSCIFGGNG